MERIPIRGVMVYPFASSDQLIDYVDEHKGILVAVNADKVVWATDQTREIINRNIGYCDGGGAVLALHKRGATQAVRIPGCDLWLDIIRRFHGKRTFYIIGARADIHNEVIAKLKA